MSNLLVNRILSPSGPSLPVDLGAVPTVNGGPFFGGSSAGGGSIFGTATTNIATGTTAQRPTVPVGGGLRFNTDLTALEYYDGTQWITVAQQNSVSFIYSSQNLNSFSLNIVDTTAGSVNLALPAYPSNFETVIVADSLGTFSSSPATVSPSGRLINNLAGSQVLSINHSYTIYVFNQATNSWSSINTLSGSGGSGSGGTYVLPQATTSTLGGVAIAQITDAQGGTDNSKAVTSAVLAANNTLADWNASRIYAFGKTAIYGGQIWIAATPVLGTAPSAGNPSQWTSIAGGSTTAVSTTNIQYQTGTYGPDTGSANAYSMSPTPAVSSLADGLRLSFTANNANTGASTFAASGFAANALLGNAHLPLQGGEIQSGSIVTVQYASGLTAWVIVGCTKGSSQTVPATRPDQVVTYRQLNSVSALSFFMAQL